MSFKKKKKGATRRRKRDHEKKRGKASSLALGKKRVERGKGSLPETKKKDKWNGQKKGKNFDPLKDTRWGRQGGRGRPSRQSW